MELKNIFRDGRVRLKEELVEKLIEGGTIIRLERIVSQKTDVPSKVYDQDEDELVMVLYGYAELEFEKEGGREIIRMGNGDYLTIPAHLRHRVTKTEEDTTWLCLFYKNKDA